jgi:hypothetical protein
MYIISKPSKIITDQLNSLVLKDGGYQTNHAIVTEYRAIDKANLKGLYHAFTPVICTVVTFVSTKKMSDNTKHNKPK